MVESLKDQIEQEAQSGAPINLSSQDVAAFGAEVAKTGAAVDAKGPIEAAVPKEASQDPVTEQAGRETVSDTVRTGAALAADMSSAPVLPEDLTSLPEKVTLTEAERRAFVDAMVSGERYVQSFTLFGGALVGKFRSRSLQESSAIMSWMNHLLREEKLANMAEYATVIRNIMLASQIEELQGESYIELKQPLKQTHDGDKVTEPGWLNQAEDWNTKNEGLVSALYGALRLFENKYWTMVTSAEQQDFWRPAESTSK